MNKKPQKFTEIPKKPERGTGHLAPGKEMKPEKLKK